MEETIVKWKQPKLEFGWIDFNLGKATSRKCFNNMRKALFQLHPYAFNIVASKFNILPGEVFVVAKHNCAGNPEFDIKGVWTDDTTEVEFTASFVRKLCSCTLDSTKAFYKNSKKLDLALVEVEEIDQDEDNIGVAVMAVVQGIAPDEIGDGSDVMAVCTGLNVAFQQLSITGGVGKDTGDACYEAYYAVRNMLSKRKISIEKLMPQVSLSFEMPIIGDSCGLAVAMALVSLAIQKPMKPCFLTGRVRPNGRVDAISNVKEKFEAAVSSNLVLVLPFANEDDLPTQSRRMPDQFKLVKNVAEATRFLFDF